MLKPWCQPMANPLLWLVLTLALHLDGQHPQIGPVHGLHSAAAADQHVRLGHCSEGMVARPVSGHVVQGHGQCA